MRMCGFGLVGPIAVFMSSSDQNGKRWPVVASMIKIGASAALYRRIDAMLSAGSLNPPVDRLAVPHVWWRSRPGTSVITIDPGENPSLRFHSVGSIGLPAML